jgi:multidrug efflux pump
MTVGTVFTMFVVPVFYSLIAADHDPKTARAEAGHPLPSLGPAAPSAEVA